MKRFFSFSRTPILTSAAAFVVALAITTPTDAAPIRFDNPAGPNHFVWAAPAPQAIWLDVTASPTDQLGVGSPSAFRQLADVDGSSNVAGLGGPNGGEMQIDSTFQFFVEGVDFGVAIPSGLPWAQGGSIITPGFSEMNIPDVGTGYLGVRFDLGAGDQFGWIGVNRSGNQLDAFAWGYETEPGAPIAAGVPEPGTLSLLVIGSRALLRRRKRRGRK